MTERVPCARVADAASPSGIVAGGAASAVFSAVAVPIPSDQGERGFLSLTKCPELSCHARNVC